MHSRRLSRWLGRIRNLDVGLHLTLVEERAVLGREISCRLWLMKRDGFPARVVNFSDAPFSDASAGMRSSVRSQRRSRVFQKTGLRLSHLDSHQHLHMFPPVFQIVRRLTRRMDNVWIRNSAGPWRKSPGVLMGRWVQQLGLNLTCLSARSLHGPPLPQMPDGMYGFEVSGRLTRSALEQILRKIPDGLYELICHPGEDDADTQTRYSHWGYQWAEELEALTAPETRVVLNEQGIALTSFARSLNTGAA